MSLIAFVVIGRLLIWTIQISGPTIWLFDRHPMLNELRECDFCLGVWVFTLLAWLFTINIIQPIYYPIFSEIVTGIATSFAVHLARIGWQTKWGVDVLDE